MKTPDLSALTYALVDDFISEVKTGKIELYNEAGLQHELGFYLKSRLSGNNKIQLERNIEGILGTKKGFEKKELDLYITDGKKKVAIELKVPVNKQIPRRMEFALGDVRFLEQLKANGFDACYFLFATHVPSFWKSRREHKLYENFNDGVMKTLTPDDVPHFMKASTTAFLPLTKEYHFTWKDLVVQDGKQWRYFLIGV